MQCTDRAALLSGKRVEDLQRYVVIPGIIGSIDRATEYKGAKHKGLAPYLIDVKYGSDAENCLLAVDNQKFVISFGMMWET